MRILNVGLCCNCNSKSEDGKRYSYFGNKSIDLPILEKYQLKSYQNGRLESKKN